MIELQMPSGRADVIAEGAILLVTVLLSAGTLERIRGLCLEHKLRRGKVVSLRGRTLTFPETFASLAFVVGLPIAVLLTSIGRNGKSAPIYKTVPAVVDVWDADLSAPDGVYPRSIWADMSHYGSTPSENLVCGLEPTTGLTPQLATIAGKTHCSGSFVVPKKDATPGFVYPEKREEEPPGSLFPAELSMKRSGDWRSQCRTDHPSNTWTAGYCWAWKWTQEEVSICPPAGLRRNCTTFKLASGAPLVDSGKVLQKIGEGTKFHGENVAELDSAHYLVATKKSMMVKVPIGEKQVTAVEPSSAAGLFSVLAVTILTWILTWLAVLIAPKRRGYNLGLHTYSGLAAYAASVEDEFVTAAGATCIKCNADPNVDGEERALQANAVEGKLPSYISLKPGEGPLASGIRISHSPDLPGAAVREWKGASVPILGGVLKRRSENV